MSDGKYDPEEGCEIPDNIEGEPIEPADLYPAPGQGAEPDSGEPGYPSAAADGLSAGIAGEGGPEEFDYAGAGTDGNEDAPEYLPDDTPDDYMDGFKENAKLIEPGEPEQDDPDAVEEDRFSPEENGAAEEGEAGGESSAEETLTTEPDDEETPQPYDKKKSPGAVIKSSKPSVLNRQLILYIVGGVAIFSLIFATFVLPILQSGSSKKDRKQKQTPAAVSPGDYYSLVPRSDAKNITGGDAPEPDNPESRFWEEETDDEILETLPPIDERYRNRNQTQAVRSGSSSGGEGGRARPDTRDDRLQAKTIQGIRGLTPSQRRYLGGPGQADPAQSSAATEADPVNPYAQFGMPPKEDYINQTLAMRRQQQEQYYSGGNGYAAQNDQSGKTAFYNRGRENSGNGYWLPPASVWRGTIFEAILTSRINTDLPGECTALVSKNVYSSQDGKYLLIPQNSRLLGTYNSSISYSQKRVQVGWHTLIRPDGYYINLGNMQATDGRGATGLPGLINEHPFQYLKAIVLLSAMNIVNNELSYSMADSNNQYVQNVMANTQEISNTLGAKIIDRALDVQPTVTIKEGSKINIVVNNTLALPPMKPYPVTYPYRRNW
jgi:type IV secretion system protein VirB10